MRFPVFANQLSGADTTQVEGLDFVQQPLDLVAIVAFGPLQLPLCHPLQKAAAGLPRLLYAEVGTRRWRAERAKPAPTS
jgi:hypothetical protein